MLIRRVIMELKETQDLKEKRETRDRHCQVWITTAGDEPATLEMLVLYTQVGRDWIQMFYNSVYFQERSLKSS